MTKTTTQNTILLIEDDELNLKLFKIILQNHNIRVYYTTDGNKALGMAQKYKPDVILTDIKLQGISGIEVLKKVRSDKSIFSTPVIAVTAITGEGEREKMLKEGFDEYISKPIKASNFIKTIRGFFTKKDLSKAV